MGAAPPASCGPLVAAGPGLIAGSALHLQQPELWSAGVYAGLALAALVLLAIQAWPLRKRTRLRLGALALGCIVVAFAATGLRAGLRLAEALPAELEGRDVVVGGLVTGLPQRAPEAWRLRAVRCPTLRHRRLRPRRYRVPHGWPSARDGSPPVACARRWSQRWA